jgi:hypothetical protein
MVKNSENFTMALIQCEIMLKVDFSKIKIKIGFFLKISILKVEIWQKRAWKFRG